MIADENKKEMVYLLMTKDVPLNQLPKKYFLSQCLNYSGDIFDPIFTGSKKGLIDFLTTKPEIKKIYFSKPERVDISADEHHKHCLKIQAPFKGLIFHCRHTDKNKKQ